MNSKHTWLLALMAAALCAWARGQSQSLACDPAAHATSYRFHLGQASGNYSLVITSSVTSITLSNLAAGPWFAAITAHNASEACHWRETSDPVDDPREISFSINGPEMVTVFLVRSTNANLPMAQWERVSSNRVRAVGAAIYGAVIERDRSPTPTRSSTGAPIIPPPPPIPK